MGAVKEKSLAFAIGLNLLLLPGLGYMYMGKVIVGLIAILLFVGIYVTTPIVYLLPTWLVMNAILIIDMCILKNRNKKKIAERNLKKCPQCAELIKREAKICCFCNAKLDMITE